MEANQTSIQSNYTERLYVYAGVSNHLLYSVVAYPGIFHWSSSTLLTASFDRGLSACWGDDWTIGGNAWLTFISVANTLYINEYLETSDAWTIPVYSFPVGSLAQHSSVAAYFSRVMIATEYTVGTSVRVWKILRKNWGDPWVGTPIDNSVSETHPSLTGRGQGGFLSTYKQATGTFPMIITRGRCRWSTRDLDGDAAPLSYADKYPADVQAAVEYLGDGDFGIVFVNNVNPIRGVYFDRESPCCTQRGDLNYDGSLDIADLTFLVAYMFKSGQPSACFHHADINGSMSVDIADLTHLVGYMFKSGPAPVACP